MKKIITYICIGLCATISSFCTKENETIVQKTEIIKGKAPAVMLTGKGAPATSLGNIGDFYIDTQNSLLYGAKTATGWGTPISLQGDAGANGTNGQNGKDGQNGTNGQDGQNGKNGKDGQDGQDGAQGNAGARGSVLHIGTEPPAHNIGEVGDWYIDSVGKKIYGPKIASGWQSAVISFL